jgi:hypothetical protein
MPIEPPHPLDLARLLAQLLGLLLIWMSWPAVRRRVTLGAMPIEPPHPTRLLAALRAVLADVRQRAEREPNDSRLRDALAKLESAEKDLDSYAGQSRPLP